MKSMERVVRTAAGILFLITIAGSAGGQVRGGTSPLLAALTDDIKPYMREGSADNSPLIVVKKSIGPYLTDGQGMTLYYFKNDSPGRNSCTGLCLSMWPIYHVEKLVVPAGADADDFGSFTRSDGLKQTTFRGWPLYYFSGDKKPGDTNGHGMNNVWYAVDPIALNPCL